jgi:hypothetical protein
MFDHQVDGQQPAALVHARSDGSDHRWAHGEVRDEVAVHDVAVDDTDARIHDPGDLVIEVSEISREDGGKQMHFPVDG